MILHIDDSMTVSDIQERFTQCFPALKIEFYQKPHHYKEASIQEEEIHPNTIISSILKNHTPENLIIISSDSAGHVEKMLKEFFGLNAQVFRKENGAWIQTSKTDKYSLKELSNLSSSS